MAIRRMSTSGRHTKPRARTKPACPGGPEAGRALRGAELRLGACGAAVFLGRRVVRPGRELGLEVRVVAVGERGLLVADHLAHEDVDEIGVELLARHPTQ